MAHDVDGRKLQVPASQAAPGRRKSEVSLLDAPEIIERRSIQSDARSNLSRDDRISSNGRPGSALSDPTSPHGPAASPPPGMNTVPRDPHFVRTIPAWVRSMEETIGEEDTDATSRLLPSHPGAATVAQHNSAPYSKSGGSGYGRNATLSEIQDRESRWKTFAKVNAYPQISNLENQVVSQQWMDDNFADYSQPWQGSKERDLEEGSPTIAFSRRHKLYVKRFQNTILQSPMVPLIIRTTVWFFSLIALALGGSIHHLSVSYNRPQGPSADMAIIVDAIAMAYLVWITYDEYTGKPLGLRPAKAKMRLIFLDLVFIVFDSANLSLAFEALSDVAGSCTSAQINDSYDPRNETLCGRQKALASVLLVALLAWIMTFAISVLRLVERVAQK
ncbi:hypothetical protein FQN54_009046 [Arachnomyces sp. PD_36]|nr:hypothetical protein FQN54_009046 [Arachnomyces sp. PD_36]